VSTKVLTVVFVLLDQHLDVEEEADADDDDLISMSNMPVPSTNFSNSFKALLLMPIQAWKPARYAWASRVPISAVVSCT